MPWPLLSWKPHCLSPAQHPSSSTHAGRERISCPHSHVDSRGNFWWHLTTHPIFPLHVTWLACQVCYEMPAQAHILYQRESMDLKLQRLVIPKSFACVLQRSKSVSKHKSLTKTLTKIPYWHWRSTSFPYTTAARQHCKEECQALSHLFFFRTRA